MEKKIITTMIKKVNVVAPIPIRTVHPPIHGKVDGLSMTPANILKCLISRATVYEVLSDGSTIKLNTSNYNTVNKPMKPTITNKEPVVESKPKSAITENEVKKPMVIKEVAEVKEPVVEDIKEEVIEPEEVIEETVIEDTVEEETIIEEPAVEEEDPELAELAAEIAKLEAEENLKEDTAE